MSNPTKSTIQCSNCGTPFPTDVYSVIDVTEDPKAKALLLSGNLNVATCPNCGTPNVIATPLLYHDPTKELLVAHVPMELNITKDEQEKVIGNLMNRLPKDNFKAYMFSPKRALTQEGLIEQILEADGISKDDLDRQQQKVNLAQQFIQADVPQLQELIKQHDSEIDDEFFQVMTMMAQQMLQNGRQDVAQAILIKQNIIAEQSSYGQELIKQQEAQQQTVEEVAEVLQKFGPQSGRSDFLELAIEYAEDEDKLQALVGLARPVFDYEFFQEMSLKIGQSPASERDKLNQLRQDILDLTTAIDQQTQMEMQNVASFLQAVVNHENPEAMIRNNMQMVDDTFMSVLTANIQEAEKRADVQTSTRLKEVYNMVISILQENMQPELRFVNELLTADSEQQAKEMIAQRAKDFGDELLEVMDAVEQVLIQQNNPAVVKRLQTLRIETQQALKA